MGSLGESKLEKRIDPTNSFRMRTNFLYITIYLRVIYEIVSSSGSIVTKASFGFWDYEIGILHLFFIMVVSKYCCSVLDTLHLNKGLKS